MTNEECRTALKRIVGYMCARKDIEALTHAMNVLEQEPIFDKIRAEIIENSIEDYKYHGCGTDVQIIETSEVLRVIDKYKAESDKA